MRLDIKCDERSDPNTLIVIANGPQQGLYVRVVLGAPGHAADLMVSDPEKLRGLRDACDKALRGVSA